ncbi:ribosomal protection-like ABC-F family protein [Pseudalkalibacillus sp. Hm43]|uniref:ribosomal protection-like ABC-F family protein n=1 Tax=Pseudalkalibacillus sp. Hm43 TaxID=3450742 RepID=UPI003F427D07
MLVLKADEVCVELNGNLIFEKANIEVFHGDKIALVGRNGIGKTTFIQSLMGKQAIKQGSIHHGVKKEDWGIVLQHSEADEDLKLRSFVEKGNRDLYQAKQALRFAEEELSMHPEQMDVLNQYSNALQHFQELDGYEWEASVDRWMLQLGLPKSVWDTPLVNLSGGQKTRAKLAKVMQREPACLLLDEPTNHLDLETMDWLADWLSTYKGTVLFISHERAFIDRVANITYELSEGGTKKYHGGYTSYKKQKEHERQTVEAAYQKQQAEKRALMEAVANYKQWFQKAHNSASERDPFAKKKANKNMTRFKAKEAALERLEKQKVEKPKETSKIKVELESNALSGRTFVRFENASFHYERQTDLLEGINFTIEKDDRIAVVGKNGTGKTTLLNLITGQLSPTEGIVHHHPQFRPGYFMQQLEGLQPDSTILDQILELPGMTESEARTILACFLFRRDTVYKKVKDLSMGEKCRVAFVRLYFSNANLLVLDEPTNYLDIETRERIEDALAIYPGAVVTVSHDPYMLEKVANRVLSLDDGFYDYRGSYKEWKGHRQRTNEEQWTDNEIDRLKLKLSNLMTSEIDPAHEEELNAKIKELRDQIHDIEKRG